MADWKYVAWEIDGRVIPILFPNELVHADVRVRMSRLVEGLAKEEPAQLHSAGFVNGLSVVSVHGESESLGGVKSNPDVASKINLMPYERGRPSLLSNVEQLYLIKVVELLMDRIKEL